MDPAPRSFAELPVDAELAVPVPFACGTGIPASARDLDTRRVTQCALSRICGVCGSGLGRPIAFVGSPAEVARNSFLLPPSHVDCAESLMTAYAGVSEPVLGQEETVPWVLVTTASFEFVRANREDVDRRPRFEPNAILSETPAR